MGAQFPELIDALAALPDCILDTDLVVLDATGHAIWDRVRRRSVMRLEKSVAAAAVEQPAVLCAVDLLALDGQDLRRLPLRERKDRLHGILPGHPRFHYVNDIATHGEALYATAVELGQEGIVGKRADSPYKAGVQTAWRKVKNRDFYRKEAIQGWRE